MSSASSEQARATGVGRRSLLLGALGVPVAATAAACGGSGNGSGGPQDGSAGGNGGGTTVTTTPADQTSSSAAATSTGSGASTVAPPPITVRGQEANYHGEQSVIGKSSATVDLYDFYFEPTVLVGSPGQEITVELLNEGEVAHTFTIEEQGIDVVLEPGQKGQTKLRFPDSGRQGVVCTYHVAAGMLGLLVTKG